MCGSKNVHIGDTTPAPSCNEVCRILLNEARREIDRLRRGIDDSDRLKFVVEETRLARPSDEGPAPDHRLVTQRVDPRFRGPRLADIDRVPEPTPPPPVPRPLAAYVVPTTIGSFIDLVI